MRFYGKPDWICRMEEDQQRENARRIENQIGRPPRCTRAQIIRKMKRKYSHFGKQNTERR